MATRIIEWYVRASRTETSVRLAAPEGEAEARAMARHLRGFDWHDVEVEDRTQPSEPEPPKVAKHRGVWPECKRCTRKHSPFEHEVEGCDHCMAICKAPIVKPMVQVDDERPEFKHGMTFDEFTDWLGSAL